MSGTNLRSRPESRAVALIAIAAVIVQLTGPAFVRAQESAPVAAAEGAAAFPPDQLDSLVAPIALYPDPLLAQVLVASTYPLEIIQLQQWLGKNPGLEGDALADPALAHVYLDISWDEVAKYVTSTPEATHRTADILNRYPDRFLFGTDVVAPNSVDAMIAVYDAYAPLWALLTPEASYKVRKGNYEKLFDAARVKVRAWE